MSGEKKPLIPISKAKIEEGIAISLKKAQEHLDGAELLASKNLRNDAIALIEFAIEEFGRAVYLRERLHLGLENIEWCLEHGREAHDFKYENAFFVLPNDLKTIWEQTLGGYFGNYWGNYYPKNWWGGRTVKKTISPSARLDALFPKFDEKTKTWHNGIEVDDKKIRSLIDELRENIRAFKI
jgi:hypothetical protein